jgi:hypothetical protein
MTTNQVLDKLDWEVFPDISFNNSMDIDSYLDKWEDILEECLDNEG